MDPKKIQVILDWPRPQMVYHVRSFLGFTNYYKKFMYRYSQIARPLNDLISGENAKKKTALVRWGSEQQNTFDKLKGLCSQAPILAYADYQKPFRVYMDASDIALGAVISQIQDGKEPVIAFASHTLNKAERRYDAHKLEFLALKWAITEKFHEYLYGGDL